MINPWRLLFQRRPRRRDFAAPPTEQRNPLFAEYHRPRSPWIVAVTLLVTGGALFILLSPRFRITAVTVTGAVRLDPVSLEAFVNRQLNQGWLGVNWKRVVFLVPTKSITANLRRSVEQLVSLDEISIERIDGQTLRVHLKERQPNLIWQTGNRQFILDDRGIIIERATTALPPDLLTLLDRNHLPAAIGRTVVQPSLLAAVRTVHERLPRFGIEVTGYTTWSVSCLPTDRPIPERSITIANSNQAATLNQNANRTTATNRATTTNVAPATDCDLLELAVKEPTLVVRTTESWELRLDSSGQVETQLEKLRIALNERLGSQRHRLKYIDIRFSDRVFYQ